MTEISLRKLLPAVRTGQHLDFIGDGLVVLFALVEKETMFKPHSFEHLVEGVILHADAVEYRSAKASLLVSAIAARGSSTANSLSASSSSDSQ